LAGAVACALWTGAAFGDGTDEPAAEAPSTAGLRHAVACPPFSGVEPYARIYHDTVAAMLEASDRVTFLDGSAAAAKRAPKFTYRVIGVVAEGDGGRPEVEVSLVDGYRNEVIATQRTAASTNAASLEAWGRLVREDMERRTAHVPFECAAEAQTGQNSLTLDRGLDAGLEPRMVLYVSGPEEELLDPRTGETVGRDAPRAYGKLVVFRVNARTAYARPLPGTKVPKRGTLSVRSF